MTDLADIYTMNLGQDEDSVQDEQAAETANFVQTVIEGLMAGDLSREQLESIRTTARNQINRLDTTAAMQLQVNDKVRVRRPTNPKYLAGATGTVTGFDDSPGTVTVKMDPGTSAARRGKSVWFMHYGSIEKMES